MPEQQPSFQYDNPLTKPRIEKLVVNIGVGEAGEKFVKAEKVLTMVTKHKPVKTLAKKTNRDFAIRKGMPIGWKVTMRNEEQIKAFLKDALWVRNNELFEESFDDYGNISFGIADYTDLPGHKYDPEIGVFGMNVTVKLARPGGRVAIRRRRPAHIPKKHRISRDEAIAFMKSLFAIEVV